VTPLGFRGFVILKPLILPKLQLGVTARSHAVDETITESEFRPGDVIYRDPLTHSAENIGNTTIRLELVELKK